MKGMKLKVCGLALAAVLCGAGAALAAEDAPSQALPLVQVQQPTNVCTDAVTVQPGQQLIARRGCCSHHKGVCGCKNGRQECCDGSLSPSCKCQADDRTEGDTE